MSDDINNSFYSGPDGNSPFRGLGGLLRDNIKRLVPYSSARDEFQGEASVFLDANEMPSVHRWMRSTTGYPDPLQYKVKMR